MKTFPRIVATLIILIWVGTVSAGGAVDLGVRDDIAPESGLFPDVAHAFDVIVVGAGPGGIAAAIQASRSGRTVALIEETSHVGGQLLSVTSMDEAAPFFREGGLFKEFYDRVVAYYGTKPVGTAYWNAGSFAYEASVGEAQLRALIAERQLPGLPTFLLQLNTKVVSVQKLGNTVKGVTTQDGVSWTAKILVDATEYGDLMPLAGAAYRVGDSRYDPVLGKVPDLTACVQDITWPITIWDYQDFPSIPANLDLRTIGPPGGIAEYNTIFPTFNQAASNSWGYHNAYRGTPDSQGANYDATEPYWDLITKTMVNWWNDYPAAGTSTGFSVGAVQNASQRTTEQCKARKRTIQFLYYAQKDAVFHVGDSTKGLPWAAKDEVSPNGFASLCPSSVIPALSYDGVQKLFPATPYVREGRRIIGVYTTTGKDIKRDGPPTRPEAAYSGHTAFAQSLALGAYPVDLHDCNTDTTLENGPSSDLSEFAADVPSPPRSGPFQVPFGSFVPRDFDGFLSAEKNLSVSRLAGGAIRLQPISMVTGQSVGALAALAISRNVAPRNIPPVLVQRAALAAGNAISMYGYTDVPHTHVRWPDVQLISTHQIMVGYGNFLFGVNDALTRAQTAVVLQKSFWYHYANPPDWTPLVNFEDVDHADPTYSYIEAMAHEGLTAGCGTDPNTGRPLFCPNDPTTAAQMAVFEVKALHETVTACTAKPYPDVPISHYACAYIKRAKELGLGVTCSGNNFCPDLPLSRGNAAAFLTLALDRMSANPTTVGACYRTPPAYCN